MQRGLLEMFGSQFIYRYKFCTLEIFSSIFEWFIFCMSEMLISMFERIFCKTKMLFCCLDFGCFKSEVSTQILLTLSQMTEFELFQTERVFSQQFSI